MIGGKTAEENVDALIAGGAQNIELMLDGIAWDSFETRMDELVAMLLKKNVTYSIHSPVWDINLTSENAQMRRAVLDCYKASILFGHKLGAASVVLHPGFCRAPTFDKELAKKRAKESILELAKYNRPFGCQLLVENVGNKRTGIFTYPEFIHFLDGMPSCVNYLVDLGHAHLCGWDSAALIKTLGNRLKALHIHDNPGSVDAHRPIGEGTIQFTDIFNTLKATGLCYNLILEYNIGTPISTLKKDAEMLANIF